MDGIRTRWSCQSCLQGSVELAPIGQASEGVLEGKGACLFFCRTPAANLPPLRAKPRPSKQSKAQSTNGKYLVKLKGQIPLGDGFVRKDVKLPYAKSGSDHHSGYHGDIGQSEAISDDHLLKPGPKAGIHGRAPSAILA